MENKQDKRLLVLFFDGTANDIKTDTNIYRLYMNLARYDEHGNEQIPFYIPGVGTKVLEWGRGRVFGRYTKRNIIEGYQWLRRHYESEIDEVYIFGFSRGAFAAQGLVGFIEWCGLLRTDAPISVKRLFERYQLAATRDQENGIEEALNLDQLVKKSKISILRPESMQLISYSKKINIKFIGVFDTVRATGIEAVAGSVYRRDKTQSKLSKFFSSFVPKQINQLKEDFMNRGTLVLRYTTHVPPIVERAFQALAIDEHRAAYAERVWIIPKGKKDSEPVPSNLTHAEQRWFMGAHANVGGGYPNDLLALIPLDWMQSKAKDADLNFKNEVRLPVDPKKEGDARMAPITNSYAEFLYGSYKYIPLPINKKFRVRGIGPEGDKERLNETIDESVLRRIVIDRKYRPKVEHLLNSMNNTTKQQDLVSQVLEALKQ